MTTEQYYNTLEMQAEVLGHTFNGKDYEYFRRYGSDSISYERNYVYHWRERLLLQARVSPSVYWCTLTFDDKHLLKVHDIAKHPEVTDLDSFDDTWLVYDSRVNDMSDSEIAFAKRQYYNNLFSKFILRLRVYCDRKFTWWDKSAFKFFAVSENGDLFNRFHFHVLFFGLPVDSRSADYILRKTWTYGITSLEKLNYDYLSRIFYITKYMFKRKGDPSTFSRKSNGLGLAFFDDKKKHYFTDNLTTSFNVDGHTYHLGRFFKQKIFTNEQLTQINLDYAQKTVTYEYSGVLRMVNNKHMPIINLGPNLFVDSETGESVPYCNLLDLYKQSRYIDVIYSDYYKKLEQERDRKLRIAKKLAKLEYESKLK